MRSRRPSSLTDVAEVHLPDSLGRLFDGRPRRASIPASSVSELIHGLDQRWPGMSNRVLSTSGSIRHHINVFVDGELAALETPLLEASVIDIIPAVSGGSSVPEP